VGEGVKGAVAVILPDKFLSGPSPTAWERGVKGLPFLLFTIHPSPTAWERGVKGLPFLLFIIRATESSRERPWRGKGIAVLVVGSRATNVRERL